ncbi:MULTISPECIES: DUF6281 family protein [Streptomyces]|uniref:DUF6281 family protein n=1 Tax=Streptomyces TaxID=1883 RepID=UPI000A368B81|nr:DUF6281 family protein [Streptomyces viridochromogenes]
MRRAVLLVAVAALTAAGCSGGGGGGEAGEASCSGLVTYDGRDYLPTAKSGFTVGERLGTATVAACEDTPNDPETGLPEATTGVYAVEGADPTEAVAVGDDPSTAAYTTAR